MWVAKNIRGHVSAATVPEPDIWQAWVMRWGWVGWLVA